jgi:hypothetical protein
LDRPFRWLESSVHISIKRSNYEWLKKIEYRGGGSISFIAGVVEVVAAAAA